MNPARARTVHELARVVADDVHAVHAARVRVEDELEQARRREDAAAQALLVERDRLLRLDAARERLLEREAEVRDLGRRPHPDGVRKRVGRERARVVRAARREPRERVLLVGDVGRRVAGGGGVAAGRGAVEDGRDRGDALRDARARERRAADAVARRVHARARRAERRVDDHAAVLVELDRALEAARVGRAADRGEVRVAPRERESARARERGREREKRNGHTPLSFIPDRGERRARAALDDALGRQGAREPGDAAADAPGDAQPQRDRLARRGRHVDRVELDAAQHLRARSGGRLFPPNPRRIDFLGVSPRRDIGRARAAPSRPRGSGRT